MMMMIYYYMMYRHKYYNIAYIGRHLTNSTRRNKEEPTEYRSCNCMANRKYVFTPLENVHFVDRWWRYSNEIYSIQGYTPNYQQYTTVSIKCKILLIIWLRNPMIVRKPETKIDKMRVSRSSYIEYKRQSFGLKSRVLLTSHCIRKDYMSWVYLQQLDRRQRLVSNQITGVE